jgi:hypothetical protein
MLLDDDRVSVVFMHEGEEMAASSSSHVTLWSTVCVLTSRHRRFALMPRFAMMEADRGSHMREYLWRLDQLS